MATVLSVISTDNPEEGSSSGEPGPTRRRRQHRWVRTFAILMALVICVGVAGLVATSSTARKQLELSFTHVPESYVSLYFTAPGNLPATVKAGAVVTLPVGFANAGPDGKSVEYAVQSQGAGGTSSAVLQERIEVPAHGSATVALRVAPTATTKALVVAIPAENISILLHVRVVP